MTETSAPARAGWRHVAALFRARKGLVAAFFLTGLGRAGAQMAILILIQRLLAGLFSGHREGAVGRLVAAYGSGTVLVIAGLVLLAAQLAASACNYWNGVAQLHIGRTVELGIMSELLRHLLGLSVPFFDRQSQGDIVQAVRHDVTRVRLTVRAFCLMIVEAALFAFLLAGAVALSPRLALWSLLVVPAASVPVFLGARRVIARSYEARKISYALSDVILQILRGIRVIKACRAEEAHAERSLDQGRRHFDHMIRELRARSLGSVVMDFLAGLVLVSIVVLGGREVLLGRLAWPALLAFVMAVRAMYGPLNNLNTHYLEIAAMGASVHRIAELLAEQPDVPEREGAQPLAAPPQRIAFEDVSFSYGAEPVLRDVSFEVRAGETIGIVGPSGSGKSTVLSLLARFYDPRAGRVTFDGRDLRDLRFSDLYASLALVTQDTFLFGATVRENLRVGRPSATDAEIEAAARAAYVHDEILSLPEGYDTPIGMGGRDLSGGQRQRLGVARALIANAPILLLDEATSSLDSVAEAAVQRAIDGLMEGRTSFIVAHRLSTLRRADRILVIDGGRVVGFAPHAELLRDCAVYRKLWEAQHLGEIAAQAA
ncbi:MAG: ABC transporter ATP-binding protein [Minicystis sp.]